MRLNKLEKETIRKWLKTTPKDRLLQKKIKEWFIIGPSIFIFCLIMFINWIMS